MNQADEAGLCDGRACLADGLCLSLGFESAVQYADRPKIKYFTP